MAFRHSSGRSRSRRPAPSASRTAQGSFSRLRRRRPTGRLPVASHGPRQRSGRPGGPRCGPDSVTVPPPGAGDVLKLSAEGGTAAEAGNPRAPLSSSSASPCFLPAGRRSTPQLGRELGQQRGPYLRPVRMLDGRQGAVYGCRQHPPSAALVAGARRRDLAAEAGHRRRVDRREAQRQGAGDVAQLEPRQRRGEQDVDVTAAARRDVGEDLAAEVLEQLAKPAAWRSTSAAKSAQSRARPGSRSRASIRPVAVPGQ